MPTISMTAQNTIENLNYYAGGNVVFTVSLSEAATEVTEVSYRTIAGSAFDAWDFPRQQGLLTFARGEQTKTIEFAVTNDIIEETDEFFTLELYEPRNAEFGRDVVVLREQAFILDDEGSALDQAVAVSSPVEIEGDDGTRRAEFTVKLSEAPIDDLELDYATHDVSAQAGEDYVATSGTLTFRAGETEKSVFVDLLPDEDPEISETFDLVVTATSELGQTIRGLVGTATLLDDDGPSDAPVISLEAKGTQENHNYYAGGTATFVVTLSEPARDAISVEYRSIAGTSTSAVDVPAFSGEVTFAPGEVRKLVEVSVVNDEIAETDESFGIEFFDPVGATLSGDGPVLRQQVFILDDDGVEVDRALIVSSPVVVEGNGDNGSLRFDVQISTPSSTPLVFDYETIDGSAEAGKDYVARDGQLRFAPGQTHATVEVQLTGDKAIEQTEFFHLAVAPGSSLGRTVEGLVGTATLLDDDGGGKKPVLSLMSTDTVENVNYYAGGDVTFTLTLSEPTVDAVEVSYKTAAGSATKGVDFPDVTDSVIFAPGETTKTVSLTATHDTDIESDESLSFELFGLTGAVFAGGAERLISAAFITDDDGVNLDRAIHVSDAVVVEPAGSKSHAVFEVRLSEAFDEAVTIRYETTNGTAKAGRDYVAQEGEIRFEAGQRLAAVNVELRPDLRSERDENFSLLVKANSLPDDLNISSSILVGQAVLVDDDLRGTSGKDLLRGTGADEGFAGLGGEDKLVGRGGDDLLNGGGGADRLLGGAGADLLKGANGHDRLFGGAGDDVLDGGRGGDTLKGGAGDDELEGGRDADTMFGGGGADRFVFGAQDAGANRRKQDVVKDFDRSEGDKIDLSAIDGNSNASGNQKLDWIGRDGDFTEAGQVRFDSARGRLEISTDGDARAEMRIVLNGVDAFGAQDLVL